jgi:hypothetical protein
MVVGMENEKGVQNPIEDPGFEKGTDGLDPL